MNFSRKTILVVGAALLAACGDKVTVTDYTPPATVAKVNSVEVAPATATLTTGQSITFTAAVNADAGVATTVTWEASAGTVTSAGVFTAPSTANPGIAVCAKSTVDTGKKGCASVVVGAAATPIPASVSINSITTNAVGTTVNPANVAGNIDVTLNVNPGNQTVSKIVLLVGGIRQDSQTYTAAQSAAMRYAADEAAATQSTFPQVVFSVNTAAYNATTGAVRWANGSKAISAQLYTTQGGSTTAASATAQTNLTFNNLDGFAISTSTAGTSAVDATGYRWMGGGALTVNAIPVIYSGATIGTVTATLGANGACAAVGAIGQATTLTSGAYVMTGTLAATQSPAGCTTTTPNLVIVTATNSAGDNLTLATNGVVNTQAGVRLDNVAPPVPAFGANPNGRAGNWINDAVSFNTIVGTSNKDGWLAAAVTDAGVGGTITYTVKAAAGTTTAKAVAGTAMTSAATLANSATAATYCAVVYAADKLGNTVADPASAACAATTQTIAFGVDRIAPILTVNTAAGNTKSLRMFSTTSGNIAFTLSDTSINAAAANLAITGSAIRYGGTAAADTLAISSGIIVPPTTTYSVAGTATAGYWTVAATAKDEAGNSNSITPYIYLYDVTSAAVSNPLQTNAGLTAGNAENFYATGTDNVDLDSAYVTHTYTDGAAAVYPFQLTGAAVQASPFTAAAPIKTTTISGAWAAMPLEVGTVASGAAISTVNLGTFGTSVAFWTTDQTTGGTGTLDAGSAANAQNSTAYTAVNGPAAAAWANTTAYGTALTTGVVTLANKRTTLNQAAGTGKIVSDTVTVTIAQTGVTQPPAKNGYSRAELWIRTNTATAAGAATAASHGFRLLAVLTPTLVYDGQAQTATWTYSYVFTPGAAFKAGTAFYGFVGYDSKFNAAITPSAAAFTIAP